MSLHVFLCYKTKISSMYVGLILFFGVLMVGVLPVFGEIVIPEWVYKIHQYWKDHQITRDEFSNAISYLQEINAIQLEEEIDPIASFLLSDSLLKQERLSHSKFSNCSAEWYITGYFTPVESDYTNKFIDVTINGKQNKYREDFVTEIKTEGWGRTISGNYLGWYDDSFHLSDNPLDAQGNILVLNTIAIDQSVIPANSNLTIPSLPSPWDEVIFTGSDIGTAIIGKHIDVYTGEGKAAHDETFRITGNDNVVCLEVE